MISEGSCDTKDWSNDAEHSALITGINYTLLYIHIENIYIYTVKTADLHCNHISQYLKYFFLLYF